MRITIFSDVHGNLPALDAVLADLRSRQPDAVYCLGDLVGYAPFPNEVVERIRHDDIPTIMGNYDDGVGFDRDDCGCAYREAEEKRRGDQSLAWTKAHVTAENKAFLRTLPSEIRFEADGRRVLLVHGSPRKINEYLFEDRPISSFQRLAASSDADIVVYGHTHKPYTKLVDGVLFLNAGSVGKPKDGDRRACYAVLDPARLEAQIRTSRIRRRPGDSGDPSERPSAPIRDGFGSRRRTYRPLKRRNAQRPSAATTSCSSCARANDGSKLGISVNSAA